jgi:uncharacterized membrane protein YkoI
MKTYLIPLVAAAGLLVGCNRSIEGASQQYNALPPQVQKAIRSQAPDAEIASISEKTENGMQVYEVEFREPGTNPKLLVSADGKILNSTGTSKTEGVAGKVEKALTPTGAVGTQFSALPEAVQKAIQSKAPQAEIADISRHETDGRVIYRIEFKDQGKNPTMEFAEDGSVVQTLQK